MEYKTLTHSKYYCKYHVVFIPKYRRKVLYGGIRRYLGDCFHSLARQKECVIEEGHLMKDHVHMLISIPPKHSVSGVIGFMKGKSAIYVARHLLKRERNFSGQRMWARGYFVSTVGINEEAIRQYIRDQEKEDQSQDELGLFK